MPAKEILSKAYNQAAAQKKNVLLMFHASWCGWCHKMDSSINNPAVRQFFKDNYIITHLVVHESDNKQHLENEGAAQLLREYKAFDQGIPFWVILDKDGKLLQDSFITNNDGSTGIIGCPATENEIASFVKILRATSSINEEALKVIAAVFRMNESH